MDAVDYAPSRHRPKNMSIGRARPKAVVACIFVDSGFVRVVVKGFEKSVFLQHWVFLSLCVAKAQI